jgi:hypothetical protein
MADLEDTIVKQTKNMDEFLRDAIEGHQRRLTASIKQLEKRIMEMTRELETSNGKLIGPKVNLKLAQQVHKDLVKAFDEIYGRSARKVVDGFDEVLEFISGQFEDLDYAMKFTGVDKKMFEALKKNTWNQFNQFGLATQSKLVDTMYNSIAGQMPYDDMVKKFQRLMTGFKDKRGGSMAQYAKLYVNDAITTFHTQVSLQKADDANIDHFLYYGNVMNTTRDFCRERVGQIYTKEEIDSWNDMEWSGKSGPPMTNRGGYNCRHSWLPVQSPAVLEKKGVNRYNVVKRLERSSGVKKPENQKKPVPAKKRIKAK